MKNPVRLALAATAVAALALTGCSGGGQSGESGSASGDALDVYLNMTTGSAQYTAI